MDLDLQIGQWRRYIERHRAIAGDDVDELEEHLREQIVDLVGSGLDEDEAFLIAVKRMGSVDAISREFAREHSERLWKQLVLVPSDPGEGGRQARLELLVVLACAIAAAATFKLGLETLARPALNAGLLILPFLAAYFAWKRSIGWATATGLVVIGVASAVVLNGSPFQSGGDTELLVMIHAPIVLWAAVGIAYAGGAWWSGPRRMDFVRFTGEWVVYYTLIALGGGVLMGLTAAAFATLEIDISSVIARWVLPIGAAGAVVVAAWLVEAKQAVVENIAPVLTRVFTPLTMLMLLAVLAAFASNPDLLGVNRELLILMDMILVLVLGLLLYALSARDPSAPPDLFDWLQLALVLAALAVDAVVLTAMLTRIAEFGASPNKVAALGLNLVLAVNLARSAWLGAGFVRGRRPFAALEGWQTAYLPIYAGWAAIVVVVLPLVFGFA